MIKLVLNFHAIFLNEKQIVIDVNKENEIRIWLKIQIIGKIFMFCGYFFRNYNKKTKLILSKII